MMNELMLGKQIREKRLLLNLSMEQVAQKADITRATLSSVENGTSNCGIQTFLKLLNVLGISLVLDSNQNETPNRDRASRINTVFDKKVNRFIVMCVEQYATYENKGSGETYEQMKQKGIIDNLRDDYEDLHGMSTIYLNDYIHSLIER